jgi:pSer/pThr/pTyr-binding forkhead associated (FHA) protein
MAKLQIFLPDDSMRTHELVDDLVKVGRVADNDLQIEDNSISSHHAELRQRDGQYVLIDLGSTNGTFVNDEPVNETPLREGDRVRFGKVDALYLAEETEEAASSTPLPEVMASTASAGIQSARPVDFVNSSPFPRVEATSDPIRLAAFGLAAVAILVVLVALYGSFFMIEVPTFDRP